MKPGDRGGPRVIDTDEARPLEAAEASADDLFKRAWWAVALRGLLAIVLGIMILTWPQMTIAVFVAMLGVYLFFDGVFALTAAFTAAARSKTWWPYMLEGLISIGVGILAFARPPTFLKVIIVLIALRSVIVGIAELWTGAAVRRTTGVAPWMLWLGGIASLAFGVLLFARPTSGMFALVWVAGVYAIVFGVLLDGEAFRLRGVERRLESSRTAA
jgi:uncharacterized membrane protein HdeD (DUF308 family)